MIIEVRRVGRPAPNPIVFLENINPVAVVLNVYRHRSFVRRCAGAGRQNDSALLAVRIPVEDRVLLRQNSYRMDQTGLLTFLGNRGD